MVNNHWLVVWNMNFMFPYIGNVVIPTDEVIFFRGLKQPPTSHVLQPALFLNSLHLAFTSLRLFYGFMALQEADGTIDSPLKKYVMWDVP